LDEVWLNAIAVGLFALLLYLLYAVLPGEVAKGVAFNVVDLELMTIVDGAEDKTIRLTQLSNTPIGC
jgi:hypothetical protein